MDVSRTKTDVNNISLPKKAYTLLRNEIIEGRLSAGYPVLEQELADRLGMSRTPIRAAIDRLKNDGLVESFHRKGIFVKPLTVADVEQAYEAAECFEGMLVKLATLRATDDELHELVNHVRLMCDMKERHEWSFLDRQFHQKLIEMAQNSIIKKSLETVAITIERVRFLEMNVNLHAHELSSNEHLIVVEAMAAHNDTLARKLHEAHWQRVREEILSYLKTNYNPINLLGLNE